MFSHKCPRCNRKMKKEFDFCPYCGLDFRFEKLEEKRKDFGLLGEDDMMTEFPKFSNSLMGNNPMIDGLLKNALNMLTKEMSKIPSEKSSNNRMNFQLSINGKKINLNDLQPAKKIEIKNQMTDEEARKLAKLPRKEAKTEVRRMSNKIVYEIDLPGVSSLKNVIISKLENSIEIKAFSKTSAYFKLIPVNLPITSYKLEKEKLLLEFRA